MPMMYSLTQAAAVVASLLLIPTPANAQFVPAPKDLITKKGYAGIDVRYKQVPTGICEQNPNVKSFSGYADVAENEHIFFWFFEARKVDPTTAPLTVWINGGPGSSSMIGLFQELGPCGVDSDGNVYNNPYSWSTHSNMLFIDQPVTTGFSYSVPVHAYADPDNGDIITLPSNGGCPDYAGDSCGTYDKPDVTLTANSTESAAPNMWKTLQGFMGAFPQYSRHGFHFTTESYGGHYGPVFNEYFEQQNAKNIPGAHKISLESVQIGNGWFDPITQYTAYYNFTVTPGNTYDIHFYNASTTAQLTNSLYGAGNCLDQLHECYATGRDDVCSTADNFCANHIEGVFDTVSGRDEYDSRELSPDPFPYNFYVDYLNTPAVQAAVGAFTNYSDFSQIVGNAFGNTGDDGRPSNTIADLKALLSQGIYVSIYAGDADYNCNWLGGEVIASLIDAPGYNAHAGYVNMSTPDGVVHAQTRQAGRFAFTRVYYSGHEVPFYQPLAALTMFDRVVAGTDVAYGKTNVCAHPEYVTRGPQVSTFREGPATVQYEVLPADATYNTTTNAPNPTPKKSKEMLVKQAANRKAMHRAGRRMVLFGK